MISKLSRFLVVTDPLPDPDRGPQRVLFSTRTTELVTVDEPAWQALDAGRFDRLPAELHARLAGARIVIADDEDEAAAVLAENRAAATSSDELYYVIQPTADCQLGCDYCGQEHEAHLLSEADQDRLVERLRDRIAEDRPKSVEIGWFGGEPLMGLPVMRALSPRLRALCDEHGARYFARIATNGFALTPAIATELVTEHRVELVEVTLDGARDDHDRRRHRKGGAPTFDRIVANLGALAGSDLEVKLSIRCNVDRRNRDGVFGLLDELIRTGIAPRLTRLYLAPVHSWGNDADALSLKPEEFARLEIEFFVAMLEAGLAPGLLPVRRKTTCLTQRHGSEVVDAYGGLFNCTEVSYVPTSTQHVRRLPVVNARAVPASIPTQVGTLATGARERADWPFVGFADEIGRGAYPCDSCRMFPVCGGACPKLWEEQKPPCPSAKTNIQDRLVLQHLASRWKISRRRAATTSESA